MKRPATVGLILLGVAAGSGAALYADRIWSGQSARPSQPAVVNPLRVPQSALELGEVWAAGERTTVLPVQNPTTSAVEVEDFNTTCTVTDVSPRRFVLRPGEAQPVSVRYKLRPDWGQSKDSPRWLFTVNVAPRIKGLSREPAGWVIRGTAKPWVTTSASVVHFGSISTSAAVVGPRTITLTAATPLSRLEVSCPSHRFKVTTHRPDANGRTFEVTVWPVMAKPIEPGPIDTHLSCQGVASDGQVLPKAVLPIEAVLTADVQPTSHTITFGAIRAGVAAEDVITLTSLTGRAVVVQGVQVAKGHGLRATLDGQRVTVRLTPTAVGAWSGAVVINGSAGGEPFTVTIPISAHATE